VVCCVVVVRCELRWAPLTCGVAEVRWKERLVGDRMSGPAENSGWVEMTSIRLDLRNRESHVLQRSSAKLASEERNEQAKEVILGLNYC
jgi:hypothetical protein